MRSAEIVSSLLLLGGMLLLVGVFLLIEPSKIYAQEAQEEVKEYNGARDCGDCHGRLGRSHRDSPHRLTFMGISERNQELIVADFSVGDDLRMVQFPDETSPRPFTAQDVTYTLGSGRYLQSYVFEIADNSFMVFPAQWNVNENVWQPLALDETWPAEGYDFVENCAYCHVTDLDIETGEWEEDGVQCEACHGPGSVHVELMDDIFEVESPEHREALNASIDIAVDAQVCGQCHSQGTSSDASRPHPIGYFPGADLEETFTLISSDNTDFWYTSGHASMPNMQYNEWIQSGHSTAYSNAAENEYFALECLVCHGESYRRVVNLLETSGDDPSILPIPEVEAERIPVGVTCSTCHYPHQKAPDEDEPPIDTAQVLYEQCTSCHRSSSEVSVRHHPVQEIFEGQSIIVEIEPVVGVHFSEIDGPRCATCHVPQIAIENRIGFSHSLKPILPAFAIDSPLQDSCTECHEIVDGQSMQDLIDSVQISIQTRYDRARDVITDETPEWLEQTLNVIEGDNSWGIHNFAYINQMLMMAEHELGLVPETTELELPQIPTYEAPLEQRILENLKPGVIVFGLTWPALLLVGLVFGILGFSAWAFFFKEEDKA